MYTHTRARPEQVPFVRAFAALPEQFSAHASQLFVRKTLGHVTRRRPDDAPREAFALQCEAFAALAATGLVSKFDGAVLSMDRVLRRPESRAAAFELVRQFLRLNEPKLAAGLAPPEVVASLLEALDALAGDARWGADAALLRSKLAPYAGAAGAAGAGAAPGAGGIPVPVPVPVPQPQPAAGSGGGGGAPPTARIPPNAELRAGAQVPLPAGSIFALCYEPRSGALVVGGRDMPLTVVGGDGRVLAAFEHPDQCVCAIDAAAEHGVALAALSGVAAGGPAAGVRALSTSPWGARGAIARPDSEMVACLKVLPGSGGRFVTGESIRAQAGVSAAVDAPACGSVCCPVLNSYVCGARSFLLDGSRLLLQLPGRPLSILYRAAIALTATSLSKNPNTTTMAWVPSYIGGAAQAATQEAVCDWDMAAALAAGASARPVRVWAEHADLVTCVCALPGQPSMFVSGERV